MPDLFVLARVCHCCDSDGMSYWLYIHTHRAIAVGFGGDVDVGFFDQHVELPLLFAFLLCGYVQFEDCRWQAMTISMRFDTSEEVPRESGANITS